MRKELLGEDGRGDGVRAAAALSSAASSTWGLPR